MPRQRHGFVLLPGFPLLSLGAALDALSAANELLPQPLYQPLLLSTDGAPVRAGSGATLATVAVDAAGPLAGAFIVADLPLPDVGGDAALAGLPRWLREQAAGGAVLGGIGTGAAVLAAAGLLDGHRATVHWPHLPWLVDRHARIVLSSNLYEIDRGRLTCGSATAGLDMLIAWLGERHGERLAQDLLGRFGLERLRPRDERQRTPAAARVGGGSAKLGEAVALMEANLAEPLPTEDIARLVGVSRRQLERLFKQHLDALPSRYYADLRLQRARRLLTQTGQSILQIGLACGFSSGSHFSNAYRAHFGRTPRDERSARAQAWRDAPATGDVTEATDTAPADAPADDPLPEDPAR